MIAQERDYFGKGGRIVALDDQGSEVHGWIGWKIAGNPKDRVAELRFEELYVAPGAPAGTGGFLADQIIAKAITEGFAADDDPYDVPPYDTYTDDGVFAPRACFRWGRVCSIGLDLGDETSALDSAAALLEPRTSAVRVPLPERDEPPA